MRLTAKMFVLGITLVPFAYVHGQEPSIEVEQLGKGRYLLTLKKQAVMSVGAGQQELVPTAKRLCGDEEVQFGKYRFETKEPLTSKSGTPDGHSFLLRQEISCGGGSAEPLIFRAEKPVDNWTPTEQDGGRIEALSYQYFSAKDTGNYRQAYAFLAASRQEVTPFDRWRTSAQQFNARAGKAKSRKIKKITWYRDPPGVAPGFYAAADFGSEFANLPVHCGYVAWHRQSDGTFRIVREEEGYIEQATLQKLDANELTALKSKLGVGCR